MSLGKIQSVKEKFLKVKFIFMNFLKKFLLPENLNLTIKLFMLFIQRKSSDKKGIYFE